MVKESGWEDGGTQGEQAVSITHLLKMRTRKQCSEKLHSFSRYRDLETINSFTAKQQLSF